MQVKIMSFKINGLDKLDRKLTRIIKETPGMVEDVLNQQAELLIGEAKDYTPVDTGLLRSSWKRTDATDGSVEVYNNVEYANHVEYGHRTRGGGFVKGRKMLQRAIDKRKREFFDDTKVIVQNLLNG